MSLYSNQPKQIRRRPVYHRTSLNGTERSENEDQDHGIEFLGLYKLCDRSYGRFSKLLWLIVLVACFGGCFYQIADRVTFFLDGTITYDIESRAQTTFQFPSVTLCSPKLQQKFNEIGYRNPDEIINITKLWFESGINVMDLTVILLCPNEKICEKPITEVMDTYTVDTSSGFCNVFTMKNKMSYKGPYTYINFIWKTNLWYYSRMLTFFIHNDTLKHKYDGVLISEFAPMGFQSTYRIHTQEFIRLNLNHNPCVSAEEAQTCINDCIDAKLLQVLSCSHPIINSTTLADCTRIYEFQSDLNQVMAVVYDMAHYSELCKCKRRCIVTKYTLHKDGEKWQKDNVTRLLLMYADEMHSTIKERQVFPLSALFSEIGGSIGLFLGLSIFAVVEFIELLIRNIVSKM